MHDADFSILSQFLTTFGPEVGGRGAEALTPELETQLRQLGSGDLPESERDDVARELLTNPGAVEFLLAQVGAK